MLQAAVLDFQFLDLLPFTVDGFVTPKTDAGRCDDVQALMVALVVVAIDEGPDLAFEIAGQVAVFQQNPVLHGLMPALDLALGLASRDLRARARNPSALQSPRNSTPAMIPSSKNAE
jgi:hypothetical protein